LLKIIYLNGLEQVYIERVLARIQESVRQMAMVTAQQYAAEQGLAAFASATALAGKTFVGVHLLNLKSCLS
jgi:hypothetical protein